MGGWWDDFSNNLATDLSPFVVLFGEAPTKQYLSECLTLVDAIIFAIAPGVISAVVSAIRVTGPPSLRAFIGRAQEGGGSAEAELCSSTSRHVCELYTNGGGIARVSRRPKLLEIVHEQHVRRTEIVGVIDSESELATAGIYTFKEYIRGSNEWIEEGRGKTATQFESGEPISYEEAPRSRDQPRKPRLDFAPNPNLTLNIGIGLYPTWVLVTTAAAGVFLQLGILVWTGIARYRLGWTHLRPLWAGYTGMVYERDDCAMDLPKETAMQYIFGNKSGHRAAWHANGIAIDSSAREALRLKENQLQRAYDTIWIMRHVGTEDAVLCSGKGKPREFGLLLGHTEAMRVCLRDIIAQRGDPKFFSMYRTTDNGTGWALMEQLIGLFPKAAEDTKVGG